jgi:hypothetical protein
MKWFTRLVGWMRGFAFAALRLAQRDADGVALAVRDMSSRRSHGPGGLLGTSEG